MAAINVSVEGTAFQYRLTVDDLSKVFGRYGTLDDVSVSTDGSVATVWFRDPRHADMAIVDLNDKVLNGDEGKLCVTPCYRDDAWGNMSYPYADSYSCYGTHQTGYGSSPTNYDPAHVDASYGYAPSDTSGYYDISGQYYGPSGADFGADTFGGKRAVVRKYTCRIEIGLENESGFSVARKLIGIKGANMKAIVSRTDAKLRLRGKDSGYMEGDTGKESDEALHLCISCTNHEGYMMAQRLALDIIEQTIDDHRSFREVMGLPTLQYAPPAITEHPVIISNGSGGFGGKGSKGRGRSATAGYGGNQYVASEVAGKEVFYPLSGEGAERSIPCGEEIESLIEKRNEARRVGRYAEADRIRNHLSARGVCLMDDPGARGRGQDVTNWRYQGKGTKMFVDKRPMEEDDMYHKPANPQDMYHNPYYTDEYSPPAPHENEVAGAFTNPSGKNEIDEKDLNTSTLSTQAGSVEASTPQKQDPCETADKRVSNDEVEILEKDARTDNLAAYMSWRGTRSMTRDFDVHSCPDPEAFESACPRPSFLAEAGHDFRPEASLPHPRASHAGVFSRRNSCARNSGVYSGGDLAVPASSSRRSRYDDFRNTIAGGLGSVFSQAAGGLGSVFSHGIGEGRLSYVRPRSATPGEEETDAGVLDPRHRFESCLPPELIEEALGERN